MGNSYIIDYMSIKEFRAGGENRESYVVDSAMFFSYSIKYKTILALLCSLFLSEKDIDGVKSNTEKLRILFEHMSDDVSKYPVIFLYNNGNDDFCDCPASDVAKKLCTPITIKDGSFHPKLYICKYTSQTNSEDVNMPPIYRFIIGSENLSSYTESVLENGLFFECEGESYDDENDGDQGDIWNQIESLIKNRMQIEENEGGCGYKNDYYGEKEYVLSVLERMRCSFPSDFPKIYLGSGDVFDFIKNSKVTEIHTPFLGKNSKLIKDMLCNKEAPILYTNHNELNNVGAKRCIGSNYKDTFKVVISDIKEDSDIRKMHYKGYVIDGYTYTGSLNFTCKAFENNDEILVRIPDKGRYFDNYKKYYEKNDNNGVNVANFYIPEKTDVISDENEISNRFRDWVKKLLENRKLKAEIAEIDEKTRKLSYRLELNSAVSLDVNEVLKSRDDKCGYLVYVNLYQGDAGRHDKRNALDGNEIIFEDEPMLKLQQWQKLVFQLYRNNNEENSGDGERVCECGFLLEVDMTAVNNVKEGISKTDALEVSLLFMLNCLKTNKNPDAIFHNYSQNFDEERAGKTNVKKDLTLEEMIIKAGSGKSGNGEKKDTDWLTEEVKKQIEYKLKQIESEAKVIGKLDNSTNELDLKTKALLEERQDMCASLKQLYNCLKK